MTRPAHTLPAEGATVRHPLWPELGTGTIDHVSDASIATQISARVHWSTGQVSTHNLAVLTECEPTPLATPTPPRNWHPREECTNPQCHQHGGAYSNP